LKKTYKITWKKPFWTLMLLSNLYFFSAILLILIPSRPSLTDLLDILKILSFFPVLTTITCALLVSPYIPYYITLTNSEISGRNSLGKRITVPLQKICGLEEFKTEKVHAAIIKIQENQEIWIYKQTENLEELLQNITAHLPEKTPPNWVKSFTNPMKEETL
jgi:hypothetical protein